MRHSRGVADTLTAATAATALWKTPDVPNGGPAMPNGMTLTGMKPDGTKGQVGLENQAKLWTTPQAHDVTQRGSGQVPTAKAGNACLARDATSWPTPAARDHKGENSPDHLTNGTGRLHLDQLPNAVAFLYSRPPLETAPHGRPSFKKMRALHRLLAEAGLFKHPKGISRPWTPPTRRAARNCHRQTWRAAESFRRWKKRRQSYWARRLSPQFVASLMGWPAGHALCDCSETEWCLWQRHMRGALSQLPTASGAWIWKPPAWKVPEQMDLF
jgi:hypothetical protein